MKPEKYIKPLACRKEKTESKPLKNDSKIKKKNPVQVENNIQLENQQGKISDIRQEVKESRCPKYGEMLQKG